MVCFDMFDVFWDWLLFALFILSICFCHRQHGLFNLFAVVEIVRTRVTR